MIDILKNTHDKNYINYGSFSTKESCKSINFHKTFPNYKPTPLVNLTRLANCIGVSKILIKDESRRFGLNAFKVLGASYATAKIISEKFGLNGESLSFEIFNRPDVKLKMNNVTLVTATDGNHGRGVAWMAQQLGCKCVVYMPKGTTTARLNNIKNLGADASIIDGSYDDAVLLAKLNSEKFDWVLIQDTAWPGYEKIPLWIMQGYLTIMEEIDSQLNSEIPTHIFVQCGVGSLPAAILSYCIIKYKCAKPIFINVEPYDAACVFESVKNNKIISLSNEMNSIMAGLCCGTPSNIAFDILSKHADFFIKCDDSITITGMNLLGRGGFGDTKIVSGESGAVTTGLVYKLLTDETYSEFVNQLKINKDSKILLISTEGDTDPVFYKRILSQNVL